MLPCNVPLEVNLASSLGGLALIAAEVCGATHHAVAVATEWW